MTLRFRVIGKFTYFDQNIYPTSKCFRDRILGLLRALCGIETTVTPHGVPHGVGGALGRAI